MQGLQWRKQGDEEWQPTGIPLKSEGHHELLFVRVDHYNKFKCATCGKLFNETPFLWWRPVPRTRHTILMDERYCIEHSPIPIETRDVPTLGEHITTLYQHIARLGQRIIDLEQHIAELEARMGNDVDSPGQQKGEEEN